MAPFVLDYAVPDTPAKALSLLTDAIGQGRRADDDFDKGRFIAGLAAFIRRPANRLLMLWLVLGPLADPDLPDETEASASVGLKFLIAAGGDWGESLAKKLFLSPDIHPSVKLAAAEGLSEAGRLDPDEPVLMWLDGELREVQLWSQPVSLAEERPGWRARQQEALALRDEGKIEEAKQRLHELAFTDDGVWLPALVDYANLLRRGGELADARRWLELCDEVAEPEPVVLFNLIGVCLQMDDVEAARQYLSDLKELFSHDELPPELRERLAVVEQVLYTQER